MSKRKGILNLKNTCFMNSIFQVLYTIPEFCLMISKFSENLDKNSYTSQLSSLINSKLSNHILLRSFITDCFELFKYSKPFTQQDAGEFFLLLIDKISAEIRGISEDDKMVEDLFRLEIVTDNFCTGGNLRLNEQFLQLDLEIFDIEDVYIKRRCENEVNVIKSVRKSWACFKKQPPVTILDCLRKKFKNFEREKVNECLICKGSCGGSVEIRLEKLPQYLFLLIKRYKFDGKLKKINRKLKLLDEITIFNQVYELVSIVRHSEFLGKKHYRAYCKDDSNWIQCDDEKIKKVTKDDVLDVQPYLILYQKKKNLSQQEDLSSHLQENILISHDNERVQMGDINNSKYKIQNEAILTEANEFRKEKDSHEMIEIVDKFNLLDCEMNEIKKNSSNKIIPIKKFDDHSKLNKTYTLKHANSSLN